MSGIMGMLVGGKLVPPRTEWVRTYDSGYTDIFTNASRYTTDAQYVCGYSTNLYHHLLAKYTDRGSKVFGVKHRRSSGANTEARSISAGSSVVVVGGYISGNGFTNALVTWHSATTGLIALQRQLGQSSGFASYVHAIAYNNGTGDTYAWVLSSVSGVYRAYLVKYNSSGTVQWQRQFSAGTENSADSLSLNSSTGDTYVTTNANNTCYLIKYNSSGVLQWQRSITGGTVNGGVCNYNFYHNVTVAVNIGGANPHVVVMNYSTSGALRWQRKLSHADAIYMAGITADANQLVLSMRAVPASTIIYNIVATLDSGAGTVLVSTKLSTAAGFNPAGTIGASTTHVVLSGTSDSNAVVARVLTDGSEVGVSFNGYDFDSITLTTAAGTLTDAAGAGTDAAATLSELTTPGTIDYVGAF